MMSIRDLINEYAPNPVTISRGYAYYLQGRVKSFDAHEALWDWREKAFISSDLHKSREDYDPADLATVLLGTVQGQGELYRIRVYLDEQTIHSFACTCPVELPSPTICKHGVALLRAYEDHLAQTIPHTSRQTSHLAAEALLENYLTPVAASPRLTAETPTPEPRPGELHLSPTMSCTRSFANISLRFTIGRREKPYVVKSISELARRFSEQAYFSYGKYLAFTHRRSLLHEDSWLYLDLIQTSYTHIHLRNTYHNYWSQSAAMGQELYISAAEFDRLADHHLHLGQPLPVRFGDDAPTAYDFGLGDPKIDITIRETTPERYALTTMFRDYRLLATEERLYMVVEKTFLCLSEAYTKAMKPLLQGLQQAEHHTIGFDQKQLRTFIAAILPQIQDHITLKIDPTLLQSLSPLALEAKMTFDYPQVDAVRGVVIFTYGEVRFNPLSDEAVPDTFFRNIAAEAAILDALYMCRFSQNEDELLLLGEENLYNFLTTGLQTLLPLGEIFLEDKLERMTVNTPPRMAMQVSMTKGVIQLAFDESKFPTDELIQVIKAYRSGKKYVRLKDSNFLALTNPSTQLLSDLLTDLDIKPEALRKDYLTLPTYRALTLGDYLDDPFFSSGSKDKNYRQLLQDMRAPIDTDFALPTTLQAELRTYQLAGYRWLCTLAHYGFGGILADDMGLGKTIQTIAFLLHQAESVPTAPSLIVVPTSLIYNWSAELDQFAPSLPYIIISGTASERAGRIATLAPGTLGITSYDALKRDIDQYDQYHFDTIIADEAQYIKNHHTQNAQALKSLQSHHRFALTGTPMENSLADLWSIMDFCMPGYLLNWGRFRAAYEIPITRHEDAERLARLKNHVAPFLLRRVKKDVLSELPDKIETTLYADLTSEESKIYQAQLALSQKSFIEDIRSEGIHQNRIKILALLTRLRQVCCSPALFLDDYTKASSKMHLCFDVLEEKISAGSQVIVFSQFTTMLDLLAAELARRQIPYLILTGKTKSAERMQLVNQFNNEHIPVFLISLKAGGVGLNLIAADTVIHYDPWWNQSAENQATDRTHRIGQDKHVHVIKLIAKDTIEEKIQLLQSKKKDLSDAIIEGRETFITSLSSQELDDLFSLV